MSQELCGHGYRQITPPEYFQDKLARRDGGFPRSITLGLTVGKGYGIAHQTRYFPELLPKLHKLAATRPSKEKSTSTGSLRELTDHLRATQN
eukprot:5764226-Amphidinium_carterae.2